MSEHPYTWLDSLTDGRIIRYWSSLILSFALSMAYLTLVVTLFAVSLATLPILVGIPMMLFTLAAIPALARMDRQIMDVLLEIERPPSPERGPHRGANLGERLGYYLGSPLTWRSLVYLILKVPIGILALLVATLIVIPLAIEVLLLAPLTIDMRLLTVRLLRFTAVGLHRANSLVLPSEKSKRRLAFREAVDEDRIPLENDEEDEFEAMGSIEKAIRRARQ